MSDLTRKAALISAWGLVLGAVFTFIADFGEWDKMWYGFLWRAVFALAGGVGGVVLNYFAGHYVHMGTNVFQSMGLVQFSEDRDRKIENSFIFVGALVGAIAGAIFIR